MGQQQTVIKSLGGYIGSVAGISGATINGDGTMTGLDNPNNYKLLSPEGKETALTLSSAGADTVTLAASGFTRDGWKLALSGLTDASMPISEPDTRLTGGEHLLVAGSREAMARLLEKI